MNPDSCRRFRLLIPLAVLAFVSLLSFAVYSLWNGVLTDVLGVKTITYWQALGLLVLSKILFGGFPGGRGKFGGHGRERMLLKHWDSLTPEQRDRMREEMRPWFGGSSRSAWCDPKGAEKEGPEKTAGGS